MAWLSQTVCRPLCLECCVASSIMLRWIVSVLHSRLCFPLLKKASGDLATTILKGRATAETEKRYKRRLYGVFSVPFFLQCLLFSLHPEDHSHLLLPWPATSLYQRRSSTLSQDGSYTPGRRAKWHKDLNRLGRCLYQTLTNVDRNWVGFVFYRENLQRWSIFNKNRFALCLSSCRFLSSDSKYQILRIKGLKLSYFPRETL